MVGVYPGGACPFFANPAGTGYAAAGDVYSGSGGYPADGGRATTTRGFPYLKPTPPPPPARAATPAAPPIPPIIGIPAAIGAPPAAPGLMPGNADANGMPPIIAAAGVAAQPQLCGTDRVPTEAAFPRPATPPKPAKPPRPPAAPMPAAAIGAATIGAAAIGSPPAAATGVIAWLSAMFIGVVIRGVNAFIPMNKPKNPPRLKGSRARL